MRFINKAAKTITNATNQAANQLDNDWGMFKKALESNNNNTLIEAINPTGLKDKVSESKERKGQNALMYLITTMNDTEHNNLNLENNLEIIGKLKGQVNEVNEKDGKTALMYAADMGVVTGGNETTTEVINTLVQNGADLNQVNKKDGMTALMYAAKAGHYDGVRALIANGADPELKGKDGKTALETAKDNLSPDDFKRVKIAFEDAQAELGAQIRADRANRMKNFLSGNIKDAFNSETRNKLREKQKAIGQNIRDVDSTVQSFIPNLIYGNKKNTNNTR
ncbi:MAG: ankyrin repeat domain-containing protein [Pseudomonadota bacterium]